MGDIEIFHHLRRLRVFGSLEQSMNPLKQRRVFAPDAFHPCNFCDSLRVPVARLNHEIRPIQDVGTLAMSPWARVGVQIGIAK
jgi:hypothetical protein